MTVFYVILRPVIVLFRFVTDAVNNIGFLQQRISFILFVHKDGSYRTGAPCFLPHRRWDTPILQQPFDLALAVSRKEAPEDQTHCFGLLRINFRFAVRPFSVAQERFVAHGYIAVFCSDLFADPDVAAEGF